VSKPPVMLRCAAGLVIMAAMVSVRPVSALADDASFGVSLAPLLGRHVESGLRTALPPLPIPILHARGRVGAVEVYAEGLPESPSIDEVNGSQRLSTRLSFFDAVVRGYGRGDRVSLGIGELIYNQATRYDIDVGSRARPNVLSTLNTSRVVGARYELGLSLARMPEALRFLVDVEPAMHGVVNVGSPFSFEGTQALGESGSQVEMQVRAHSYRGPLEFGYGLRYLNYVTKFDSGGALADRNTGFLPYVTVGYHVGR